MYEEILCLFFVSLMTLLFMAGIVSAKEGKVCIGCHNMGVKSEAQKVDNSLVERTVSSLVRE